MDYRQYQQDGIVRSPARDVGIAQTQSGTLGPARVYGPIPTPAPSFAAGRRINVDLSIDRSAGHPALSIDMIGTTVWCAAASDDAATIDLAIGDWDTIPFAKHYKVEGVPFRRLVITHPAQAGKSLVLIVINDPSGQSKVE